MPGAANCAQEQSEEVQAIDSGDQGRGGDASSHLGTSAETLHSSAENAATNVTCAEENKTADTNEPYSNDKTATWRPTWLQPIVLASFSGLFLVLSILLLLISLKAKRSDGLFETWQGFRLAWRFGPTAVLTIVCAFWARVELQTMRYMPWIAARNGEPFDLDMDYASMITPTILVQSLRRRHVLVFLVSAIALGLKAELLLAAGLFNITPVIAEVPVDVEILDMFNPTFEAQNYTTETLRSAFFAARAIQDFDMIHPFGVDARTAYQTFASQATKTRGTLQTPLKAVVDGFFSNMDCTILQSFSVEALNVSLHRRQDGRVGRARGGWFRTDLKLQFEGCDETLTLSLDIQMHGGTRREWFMNSTQETSFLLCPSLPSGRNRFLYSMSEWDQPNGDMYSLPELKDVAGILCSPSSWLSKVEVVDDGYDPNITVLSHTTNIPLEVNIWEVFTESIPQSSGGWTMPSSAMLEEVYGPLALDVRWFNNQSIINITSERLRNATIEGSKRFGPLLGHYILRQSSEGVSNGTSLAITTRLSVRDKNGLSMSVVFLAIAFSVGYASIQHRHCVRIWTRDPATTFGFLIYLASHPDLAGPSASACSRNEKRLWEESTFSPLCLRTWVQATFTAYTCGLIISISVVLHLSQSQRGLPTASDDESWQLMWTTVPSLVALSVALYLSSCDAAWRSISTLSSLSMAPRTSQETDVSTSDMFGFLALLTLFRQRIYIASAVQILVLFCGLLTTLAAVVFSIRLTQESVTTKLQQNSWFGDPTIEQPWNRSKSASDAHREKLGILFALREEMNYTYPENTFADLAFPNLTAVNLAGEYPVDMQSGAKLEMMATIPALKLTSACKSLPQDALPLNVTVSETEFLATVELLGNCPNGTHFNFTLPLNITESPLVSNFPLPPHLYFGAVLPSAQSRLWISMACNLVITHMEDFFEQGFKRNYIWGAWDTTRSMVKSKCLFECDYSWSEVSVKVNLLWANGKFLIDSSNPPQLDNSTPKSFTPPLKVPFLDLRATGPYSSTIFPVDFQEASAESGYLDPHFKHITLPYGNFPVNVFGDPSMSQEILRQLDYDLAFTGAQLANLENRLPLGQDSNTSAFPSAGLPPINATTTLKRNRLVQSPAITYIIISILGPVLVFQIFVLFAKAARRLGLQCKILVNEKGTVPKGFSSPKMMAALLHGTNATKYIPADAHTLSPTEIHQMMGGVRFQMGWFMKESDQTMHYTIGVLDDEDFIFMGSKADMAAMGRHRARAD